MHRRIPFICLLLITFAVNDSDAEDTRSLDTIRWVLGNWVQVGQQTTTQETWTELHRSAFKGISVTTVSKSGKIRARESLFLTEMSDAVYYFAKVHHNKYPVPFELTSCSSKHAIFENSEHDFPKKLEYRLVSKDAMDVIVSDGGARSFRVRFKKATDIERNEE